MGPGALIKLSTDPPNANRPQDRIVWKLNKDGDFSTSSAYEYLLNLPELVNGEVYKLIWSWVGPGRVRLFLWKMAQKAIVTNLFRLKRGLTNLDVFPMCELEAESILHLTRNCRSVMQVWYLLSENNLLRDFFTSDIQEWMTSNLKCTKVIQGVEWRILFGATTSGLWQRRNNKVFNGKVEYAKETCCSVIHQARAFYQSVADCVLTHAQIDQVSHNNIHWIPPDFGYWKLNCDGAVSGLGGSASAGGVLRDHFGNFVFGFASDLPSYNVIQAELRAVSMGIKLAWLKGFRKVVIETDSAVAVCFIKAGCSSRHLLFNLISETQDLLCRDDIFSINHVLREANQVADCFAKFGLSLDKCSRFFSCMPHFVSLAVRADCVGTAFPRGC